MTSRNRRISNKRERLGAKELSGRTHSGSGSQWHSKADFSNENFIVEDKFTKDAKFSLTFGMLKRVVNAGKDVAKIPVLKFGFESSGKKNYAVMNEKDVLFNKKSFCSIQVGKVFKTSEEELVGLFGMIYSDGVTIPNLTLIFAYDLDLTFRIFEWDVFVDNCDNIIGM